MEEEGLVSRFDVRRDFTGAENHCLIAELTPDGRDAMHAAMGSKP